MQGMHGHSPPDPKNILSFDIALKSKKLIARETIAFTFEKPKGFNFKAGQHIRMTLINPSETDNEGNSRFLSIASTPQEKDLLIAVRMRNTSFKRVMAKMQIGEKVKIQMRLDNPHGSFALHEDSAKPAVFIVGGIGIVPAYSIIKDAIKRKLNHKIFLFYSNRKPEDAPFLKELQILTKKNPKFILVATMTDPKGSLNTWHGKKGHIDLSLINKYLKESKSSVYYLAGLPEMVSSMKQLLIESGVNENSIRAEEFTGFNLNEIFKRDNNFWKNHFSLVAIGFGLIILIGLHLNILTSLAISNLDLSLISNPFFYTFIALTLFVTYFKFKHLKELIKEIKK